MACNFFASIHKLKQIKNKNCGFYTLFLQCLSGDGGRVPAEFCKLSWATAGRFGGGDGVNRLYPQLPGQDRDLAQAPYLSFSPTLRIQNREEGVWLVPSYAPYRGKVGSKAEKGPPQWGRGFQSALNPTPHTSHTQECAPQSPLKAAYLDGGKQPGFTILQS